MAGSKGTKYYDVFLDYNIWLSLKDDEIINEKLFNLLIEIDKSGSIMTASRTLGISYRKAWGDIQKAQKSLGFEFVSPKRGGKDGGLSTLTEDGKTLINSYRELKTAFDNAIHDVTRKFFRTINNK